MEGDQRTQSADGLAPLSKTENKLTIDTLTTSQDQQKDY